MSSGLRADFRLSRGELELDVELRVDEVVALMGPNGAGKTTALKALIGALRPDGGRITLEGRTLYCGRDGIDVPVEERQIAYVPQGLALFPHMSVLENVRFALPSYRAQASAEALLDGLDLLGSAGKKPRDLSGGEQQRVALARAMASEPRLLLLDEPLSAADPERRPRIREFLASWLFDAGLPALVVTHDPADARALADRIVVLESGKVTQSGELADVAVQPRTPFVAALTPKLLERQSPASRPFGALSEDE